MSKICATKNFIVKSYVKNKSFDFYKSHPFLETNAWCESDVLTQILRTFQLYKSEKLFMNRSYFNKIHTNQRFSILRSWQIPLLLLNQLSIEIANVLKLYRRSRYIVIRWQFLRFKFLSRYFNPRTSLAKRQEHAYCVQWSGSAWLILPSGFL